MPVTIQPATLKYKNQNGSYQNADCLKGDKGDAWIVTNSTGAVVSTYRYTTQSNNL